MQTEDVQDIDRSPNPVELVRQGSKAAGAGAVAGAAVGAFVGAIAGAFAGAVAWSFATMSKEAWRRYRDHRDRE
jgi:uncharacterized protein YqgC (DUF456 family)